MSHSKTITAYAVRALEWTYNDEYYSPYEEFIDEEEQDYPCVKLFLNPDRAEVHRRELDRKKREQWPHGVFMLGSWYRPLSTRSDEEIAAGLRRVGLDPPIGSDSLLEWIRDHEHGFTEEQSEALWELCDHRRFFEVVPVEIALEG